MSETKKRLGDILVDAGTITLEQLKEALHIQKDTNKRLGEVLINMGLLSENDILSVLSTQLMIEMIDLERIGIKPEVARLVPKALAEKYKVIPVMLQMNSIVLAMADPLNYYAIDDVQFITQKNVIPKIATEKQIKRNIELYLSRESSDRALEELKREFGDTQKDNVRDDGMTEDVRNAPAVRLVNSIITQAINMKASDIHIEPYEFEVRVRFRVDGVLSEVMKIPKESYSAISTRFKIMANMNIAEKRRPLDGRIEMSINNASYDFRVSTLPTVFGEKLVLRILDRTSFLLDRAILGFTEAENDIMDRFERAPYGIILVTGPTGSGKSTTLYTMLREVSKPEINIVTVEDPVEYMLGGINQVQVNNQANLTFATGLRSILRQDPDIVMIGEIRDEETAQIAIRAAITGHLVLSTLHTNDAPSTVSRLVDMGVEPYLVADALVGIMAQRLVRKLCPDCKVPHKWTQKDHEVMKTDLELPIFMPRYRGCPRCNNTGYKGRTGIHEIMVITNRLKMAIETNENSEVLRKIAKEEGMIDLYGNCRELVIKGVTSLDEMVKTVYARD